MSKDKKRFIEDMDPTGACCRKGSTEKDIIRHKKGNR